jgi:DedD protein
MRLLTVLALASSLLLAGCGDDAPEPQATPRPAPQRPAVDTAVGDTATADPEAGRPDVARAGEPRAAEQPGQRSGPSAGRSDGEAAAGAPAGDAGDGAPESDGPSRLYTVQVGAFREPETARLWEGRLESQGLPVWVAVAELGGETYYRLRVGAVPTVSEARRLGGLIGQRYEWPVWIAPVTPADRVPSGAVETTRRLLGAD